MANYRYHDTENDVTYYEKTTKNTPETNYGLISFGVLVVSLTAIWFGFKYSLISIAGLFSNAFGETVMTEASISNHFISGQLLMILAGLGLPSALALAGAALATNRGSFFGLLTYMLVLLPVLIYAGMVIFGADPSDYMPWR